MPKIQMTGPGKGERRLSPLSTLLFNFDIEGAGLKPTHHDFLRMYVVPVLKRGGSVSIVGLASRTGSVTFNHRLSQARADRTLDYLRGEVRNGFSALKVVGYGELRAKLEGYPDNTEDPRFRSVMVYAWSSARPLPAPPKIDLELTFAPSALPEIDWADESQKDLDKLGMFLSALEFVPRFAEIAGRASGILNIVTAVVQMPLLWASVRHHNLANGTLQGFWDAIQDMADAYSDPRWGDLPRSKWPPLPIPNPHAFDVPGNLLPLNERQWMEGRRNGCKIAYELFRDSEGKKRKGVEGGRTFLHKLSKEYGKGVGAAVRQLYDAKLREMGIPGWPLRD